MFKKHGVVEPLGQPIEVKKLAEEKEEKQEEEKEEEEE